MRRLAPAVLLAAGCLQASDVGLPCRFDADCEGECARGDVCIEAGSGRAVTLRWTVVGSAPSPVEPEACAGIAALDISFRGGGDELTYYPVPCELGQSHFDVLPPWLDRAVVTAFDAGGVAVDQRWASLGDAAEIAVDLAP